MRFWMTLLVLLVLTPSVSAETIIVSFGDLANCPPCRQLERAFASRPVLEKIERLKLRRAYTDVATAKPELLQKWGVTAWPTTFLMEVDAEGKLVKGHKSRVGEMSVDELLRFIDVDAPLEAPQAIP